MDSFQSNEPDIAHITPLVEHPVLNLGAASHRSLPLVACAPHLELHQLPNRSIISQAFFSELIYCKMWQEHFGSAGSMAPEQSSIMGERLYRDSRMETLSDSSR